MIVPVVNEEDAMRYGWPPYIPVAMKRRKAERELQHQAKNGQKFQPIAIEGRKIAKTFWGKAWCENLESYSDFENRLPRGRTYVRNGCVCHLEIAGGIIEAKVMGSELYTVTIGIKPLPGKTWEDMKRRCTGKIGSLLDLLGGKLDAGVMEIVTDRKDGLFPKPAEITMDCSCPDWATMCKHVAAVLYGVGARLDERPELLFTLRGVNQEELISASLEGAVANVVKGGSRRRIASEEISEVFGIEMDSRTRPSGPGTGTGIKPQSAKKGDAMPRMSAGPATGKATGSPSGKGAHARSGMIGDARSGKGAASLSGAAGKKTAKSSSSIPVFPAEITGAQVRELRTRLGLTGKDFALLLGVSGGAVSVWEKSRKALNLQDRSREALKKAWKKATKPKRGASD